MRTLTTLVAGVGLVASIAAPAHAADIVLHDTLGTPPMVNTVPTMSGYRADQVPASTSFPFTVLTIPADVELRQIVIPIGKITSTGTIYAQSFRLRLWESPAAVGGSVWQGTLLDMPIAPVIEPWGTLPNGRPKYMVTFDLSNQHITLAPGTVCFNVAVITPDSISGFFGPMESMVPTSAPPDYFGKTGTPPHVGLLCSGPPPSIDYFCQYTGKFAFRLTAVTIDTCPACAADYDNNGGVDGADLAQFFAEYESGEACADVDQNGGVDGADLAHFFLAYEQGGC